MSCQGLHTGGHGCLTFADGCKQSRQQGHRTFPWLQPSGGPATDGQYWLNKGKGNTSATGLDSDVKAEELPDNPFSQLGNSLHCQAENLLAGRDAHVSDKLDNAIPSSQRHNFTKAQLTTLD